MGSAAGGENVGEAVAMMRDRVDRRELARVIAVAEAAMNKCLAQSNKRRTGYHQARSPTRP